MPPRRSPRSFPLPRTPHQAGHPLRGFWQFMYHLDGVTLRAVLQNARQQRLFNRAAELAYLALLTLGTGLFSLAGAIATFPWLRGVFTPWVPAPSSPWPTGALLPTLVHTPLPANLPLLGLGLLLFAITATATMATLLAGLAPPVPAARPRPRWRTLLLASGLVLNSGLWLSGAIALRLFHQGKWPANLPTGEGLWPGGVLALGRFLSGPLAIGLVVFAIALIYRFGPRHYPRQHPWIPGAALTTLVWWGLVTLPRLYTTALTAMAPLYGAIAQGLTLLLGLYLGCLTLLLGAQVNQVVGQRLSSRRPHPPGSQPCVPPPAFDSFTIRRGDRGSDRPWR
jgi:membrane protein